MRMFNLVSNLSTFILAWHRCLSAFWLLKIFPMAAAPAASVPQLQEAQAQQKGRFAVSGTGNPEQPQQHPQPSGTGARRSYSVSPAAAAPIVSAPAQHSSMRANGSSAPPSRAGSSTTLNSGSTPGTSPGSAPPRRQFDVRPGSMSQARNPAGGARASPSAVGGGSGARSSANVSAASGSGGSIPAAWRHELPALSWLANEWKVQQALIHSLMLQGGVRPPEVVSTADSPPGVASGAAYADASASSISTTESYAANAVSCRSEIGVSRTVSCESNCAELGEGSTASSVVAASTASSSAANIPGSMGLERRPSMGESSEDDHGSLEERLRRIQLEVSDLAAANAELRRENLTLLTQFHDARAAGAWVRAATVPSSAAIPPPSQRSGVIAGACVVPAVGFAPSGISVGTTAPAAGGCAPLTSCNQVSPPPPLGGPTIYSHSLPQQAPLAAVPLAALPLVAPLGVPLAVPLSVPLAIPGERPTATVGSSGERPTATVGSSGFSPGAGAPAAASALVQPTTQTAIPPASLLQRRPPYAPLPPCKKNDEHL